MTVHRFSAPIASAFAVLAVLAAALPGTAAADPVADFYQGRNVAMIIGFPPGGGYDAYARAIAAHIGDHIPGKPHVVVQNMPGASSLRAANFIFNSAPRDGTAMGAFSAGTVFAPLLGNKKAKFVSTKFTWIGNSEKSVGTCAVWHTSKIKSLNDLLSHPGIFGASGVTGVMSEFPRAMDALIGARARVIHGYAGGTGVLLAMERGEVDGSCAMALSTLKSVRYDDWKSGRLVVLVQLGLEPEPDLKGVPSIYDYARSDDDRKAMEVIFGRQTLGRPIGAPPGLPPGITKALRAAFEATMTDPAFLKDAAKRRLNIAPMSGAQVDKLVARFHSFSPAVIARASKALEVGKVARVKLKALEGTIAKVSKKKMTVTDANGTAHTVKIHAKRSKVTIAGKKKKTSALKVGMKCHLEYFGDNDLAPKVDCK